MILGKYTKQPAETLDYDIDFTDFLADGDKLAVTGNPPVPSPLNVTVSPAGLTVGSTFVISQMIIKQWISGGVDGVKYKVTVTATTEGGRVVQNEFIVTVKDV